MGLFKKLSRGVKKVVKKNKGGLSRLVKKVGPGLAMAAVGATAPALVVKAASAAKSLGKKARGIETPKSLAPVIKAATVRVKRSRSKMPGGAPMPHIPPVKVGMARATAVGAKKSLYKSTKKRRTTRKASTGGSTRAPSAKQLAAREKFAAAARARAKAKKAA